jgi:hypothetical protein
MYEIPKNLHVISLDSFSLIEKQIEKKISKDTLLLFDVHWTLLKGIYAPLFPTMRVKYEKVFEEIFSHHTPEEKELSVVLALREGCKELMELSIPEVLLGLSKTNCKMLACSSYLTGKIGADFLEEDLFQSLRSLGVDFSSSFPDLPPSFSLDGFPAYRKNLPMFYHGILLTNYQRKGKVIFSFLQKASYKPSRIIMVDNNPAKIENVKLVFGDADPSIEFEGIFYTKALQNPPKMISEEAFSQFWEDFAKKALRYSKGN